MATLVYYDENGQLVSSDVVVTVDGAFETTLSNILSNQTNGTQVVNLGIDTSSIGASSISSTGVVATMDALKYRSIYVQVTGTWVATVSWQGSNDNTNWQNVAGVVSSATTGGPGVTTTTNGLFIIPVNFRYFRINVTSFTSGTVTAQWLGSYAPPSLPSIGVTASINQGHSTTTVTPSATANGVPTNGSQDYASFRSVELHSTGTWTATVNFEGSIDNTNWFPIMGYPQTGGPGVTSFMSNGFWVVPLNARYFRVNVTNYVSGTVAMRFMPGYVSPTVHSIVVQDGGGSLTVDGTVALDSTTLSALEEITVHVADGTISLDSSTLAALENIIVSGTVALDSTTLAALENINAAVTGTVELGATTLAALESINATVTGTVAVSNFPSTYPVTDNGGSLTVDDGGVPLSTGSYANAASAVTTTANSSGVVAATSIEVTQYRAIYIQTSGTYSATITPQGSNDNTNWFSVAVSPASATSTPPSVAISSNNLWFVPVHFRYFRLNVTTYSSGTINIVQIPSHGNISPNAGMLGAVTPGTYSSALGKAEDSTHTDGDTGVFVLGVRNDAGSTTTSATGDYSQISTDSAGRVGISDLGGSITVDGTVAVTGTQTDALTNTQLRATPVPVSGTVSLDSTSLAALEDINVTVSNEVEIKNDSGNPVPISDAGGSLTVDGTVAVSNFPSTYPVTDNGGSITVDDGGTTLSIDDGGGSLTVDGTVAVSNFPATQTVSGTVEITNDVGNAIPVSGTVAISNSSIEISNDTGNPVPVSGTVTISDGSGPVTVDGTVELGSTSLAALEDINVTVSSEVEIKNDTGNPVPISDAGGSLTVDGTVAISTIAGAITPGTGTGNLGKAEDAAHTSGDTGVAVWGVRNDAAATRTSADGDYSSISTDSAGRVGISDLGGSITVDGTVDLGSTSLAALENITVDGTVAVSSVGGTVAVTGPLTDAQLRATAVPVTISGAGIATETTLASILANQTNGTQKVRDDYATESHASDQTGAGAVLTFTVSAGQMVMVDVDNTSAIDYTTYRARATVDGSTPSATSGFVCRSGTTTYLGMSTSGTVKVYAPNNTVVSVQSMAR